MGTTRARASKQPEGRGGAVERVAVIGAGLAGLAAARALASAGYEVVVFEARDRVGGRVHTEDGLDLGAHWIHGTEGNPLTNLARELGLATIFTGGDSSYTGGWEHMDLRREGSSITAEEKEASILFMDDVRDEVEAMRREDADAGRRDVSLGEAVERVLRDKEVPDALRRHAAWHLTLMAREDWASGADRLSLRWWDEGYEVYGYGDSVFVNGLGELAHALAEGLDVRLGHVVRRIVHGPNEVIVEVGDGAWRFDHAIVTLPLGVLKAGQVTFEPPLPDPKQRAIERLGMGDLAKVVLEYPAPFWPRQQYVFGNLSSRVSEAPTAVVNLYKTHRRSALVVLAGGDLGRAIESWGNERVHTWAHEVVRNLFGEGAPAPARVRVTSWSRDPFARGAYSFIAVGATPADIDALAAPVGTRLGFAGEATLRTHWACIHSAYVSGLREAARISGDVTLLPPRHFTENRRWRDTMARANRFFNLVGRALASEDIDARVAVLGATDVFGSVPAAELRVLATMFSRRLLPAGAILCTQGEKATCAFAVESGAIDVHREGFARPVARMRRGETVGEYGLFVSTGRTATLVAAQESVVLALEYSHFQRFLLAFPDALMSLLGVTLRRMHEAPTEAGPMSWM